MTTKRKRTKRNGAPSPQEMRIYHKVAEYFRDNPPAPEQWIAFGRYLLRPHLMPSGRIVFVVTQCEIDTPTTEAFLRGDYEQAAKLGERYGFHESETLGIGP